RSARPRRRPRLLLALDQLVILINRQILPRLLAAAPGPFHRELVDLGRLAQPEDAPRIVGRHIAAAAHHEGCLFVAVNAAQFPDQPGTDDIAMLLADQFDAEPVVAGIAFVPQDRHRLVLVANGHVDAAVVVEITVSNAAADMARLKVAAGPGADVGELPLPARRRITLVS